MVDVARMGYYGLVSTVDFDKASSVFYLFKLSRYGHVITFIDGGHDMDTGYGILMYQN